MGNPHFFPAAHIEFLERLAAAAHRFLNRFSIRAKLACGRKRSHFWMLWICGFYPKKTGGFNVDSSKMINDIYICFIYD